MSTTVVSKSPHPPPANSKTYIRGARSPLLNLNFLLALAWHTSTEDKLGRWRCMGHAVPDLARTFFLV